ADQVQNWSVTPLENGRETLVVDLQGPLEPQESIRLTLGLRSQRQKTPPGKLGKPPTLTRTFPEVVPENARLVSGSLAIRIDRSYQAPVHAPLAETAPESARGLHEGEATGLSRFAQPWDRETPDHYYAYQGRPVSGSLMLQSRPSRVRAHCTT